MKSLGWHFRPWAPRYIEMYTQHLDHPYQEVRGAVADNLRNLSELRLHPSYPSVQAFLRDCQSTGSPAGLMVVDAAYEAMIDDFGEKLAAWRAVRQPTAQGTQAYDKAALTSALSSRRYFPPCAHDSRPLSSHLDLDERVGLPHQHRFPLHYQAPARIFPHAGGARQRCEFQLPLREGPADCLVAPHRRSSEARLVEC